MSRIPPRNYQFWGRHLMASFGGCDENALRDDHALLRLLKSAARDSGATVIGTIHHHFLPSGFTGVVLLAESHASIHTYPEHRSCFVDLFTCGSRCDPAKFTETLTAYLRPTITHDEMIIRSLNEHFPIPNGADRHQRLHTAFGNVTEDRDSTGQS